MSGLGSRLAVLALAVFASVWATGPAAAQDVYRVGPWTVRANYSGGEFQNCTITSDYGRGVTGMFMLTRQMAWGLGVDNPAWNLNVNAKGMVSYWVDNRGVRQGQASAISRSLLLVPLADSRQLFEEIRWGAILYFRVDSDTYNLTLNGTAVALDELLRCVQRRR